MSPISRLVTKEYRQISHHDTTARPRTPGGMIAEDSYGGLRHTAR